MSTGTGLNTSLGFQVTSDIISTSVTLNSIIGVSGTLPSDAYLQLSLSPARTFPDPGNIRYDVTSDISTGIYTYTAQNTPPANNAAHLQVELNNITSVLALPPTTLTGTNTLIKLSLSNVYAPNMEGNYTANSFGSYGRSLHTDAFATDASWNTLIGTSPAWDSQNNWIRTNNNILSYPYTGPFVSITLPNAASLDRVDIQAMTNGFVRGPRNFKVYGTNYTSNWTEIYTASNVSWTSSMTTKSFALANKSEAFLAYAVVVRTIDGDTSNAKRYLTLSNVRFYTTLTPNYALPVTGTIANERSSLAITVSTNAPVPVAKTLFLSPSAVLSVASQQKATVGRVLLTAAAMAICGHQSYVSKLESLLPGETASTISGALLTAIKAFLDDVTTKQAILDYVRTVAGDILENYGNGFDLVLDPNLVPMFAIVTTINLALQYTRFNQVKVLWLSCPFVIRFDQ